MNIKKVAAANAVVLAAAMCCCMSVNAKECACASSDGAAYPETIDEGFVPLFNGKDLTGWVGATNMYGVEEYETRSGKVMVMACFPERRGMDKCGNLCTEKEFENFILRFEFMMYYS